MKKKLLAVLRAAVYGAALFDAIIILDNFAYRTLKGSDSLVLDLAVFSSYIFAIPTLLTGINPYIVNGVVGAALFATVAAIWQFGIKTYEK